MNLASREEIFKSYANHPYLSKSFKRLSASDIDLAINFIRANVTLNKGEFESRVFRIFLDKSDKPKNWIRIEELLVCANSAFKSPS